MTNKLNGYAAECMIASVIGNMGYRADLGLTKEQVLEEIYANTNIGHYKSALAGIEKDFGLEDASVNIIVDCALGVDTTFESEDGECISIDVTVNPNKVGRKKRVSKVCAPVKHRLGYVGHLIVLVDSVKGYAALSEDEIWYVIDSINDAVNKGESVVKITIK